MLSLQPEGCQERLGQHESEICGEEMDGKQCEKPQEAPCGYGEAAVNCSVHAVGA